MTRVVEGTQLLIGVRVGPRGDQRGIADRVSPGGARYVDHVSHRRQLSVRSGPALIHMSPHDVIDLLLHATVSVQPALDGLDAVQVVVPIGFFSAVMRNVGVLLADAARSRRPSARPCGWLSHHVAIAWAANRRAATRAGPSWQNPPLEVRHPCDGDRRFRKPK